MDLKPSGVSGLETFVKDIQSKYGGRPGVLSPKQGSDVILMLIEVMVDGAEPDLLKFAARFLTPQDYDDLILERTILHRCGYPLCNNDPKGIKSEHQIRLRKIGMVLPSTYLSKYCNLEHYQASRFYQSQLSEMPVYARKNIAYLDYGKCIYEQQICLLEEVQKQSKTKGIPLIQVIEDFKSLSIANEEDPEIAQLKSASIDLNMLGLTSEVASLTLSERDPKVPRLDAAPEEMDPDPSKIDGYAVRLG